MLKYILTIVLFLIAVFVIKVAFPLWRFYTLASTIIDTYEMLDVVILKAMDNQIEEIASKKIVLKYGMRKVTFANIRQAYETLAHYCEKALSYAEIINSLPIDKTEYIQEKEKVTNIYNIIRMDLWKNQ